MPCNSSVVCSRNFLSSRATEGSETALATKPDSLCDHAPSVAFSKTDNMGKRRGFWKVRATPTAARLWTDAKDKSSSPSFIAPDVGW